MLSAATAEIIPRPSRIVILYGSVSGNGADLADRLKLSAHQHGFESVLTLPMCDYNIEQLPFEQCLILVTSTYGQGEPPENARAFYRFMLRKDLPHDALTSVHFATFGLGDSSYPIYNAIARRLHQRMLECGGIAIAPRGLGDDQAPYGYEEGFSAWNEVLWKNIRQIYGIDEKDVNHQILLPNKYNVYFHSTSEHSSLAGKSNSVSQGSSSPLQIAPCILPPYGLGQHRSQPQLAILTKNVRLTPPTHWQDVRHIELELCPLNHSKSDIATNIANGTDSSTPRGLIEIDDASQYRSKHEPGDVIDVYPRNSPSLVQNFLEFMNFDAGQYITIAPTDPSVALLPHKCTIQELFEVHIDILGTPRRSFFEYLSHFATDELQREKLQEFSSLEGQNDLNMYNYREKRTYAEVLSEFHSVKLTLEQILTIIPRISPRSFSLASAAPALHICVAIFEITTPLKRTRMGLCSSYFTRLEPSVDTCFVNVYVKKGHLRLPKVTRHDDSISGVGYGGRPVIMCGPGTGMAPFRAICQQKQHVLSTSNQQRREDASTNAEIGKISTSIASHPYSPYYLFYGNRNRSADFFYEKEWLQMHQDRTLELPIFTAFSRDTPEKYYVQHVMMSSSYPFCPEIVSPERSDAPPNEPMSVSHLVFDLLVNQKAYFVLAGAAGSMPKAIRIVMREILQNEGNWTQEQADQYLRDMETQRRYLQEVW